MSWWLWFWLRECQYSQQKIQGRAVLYCSGRGAFFVTNTTFLHCSVSVARWQIWDPRAAFSLDGSKCCILKIASPRSELCCAVETGSKEWSQKELIPSFDLAVIWHAQGWRRTSIIWQFPESLLFSPLNWFHCYRQWKETSGVWTLTKVLI